MLFCRLLVADLPESQDMTGYFQLYFQYYEAVVVRDTCFESADWFRCHLTFGVTGGTCELLEARNDESSAIDEMLKAVVKAIVGLQHGL